jgi:nucleotide-binding universal stress UspA family protein
MFQRILVCLDGSELAEQILPYAKGQASRFSSEVHLLNVLEKADKEHEGKGSEKLGAPVYLENTAALLRKDGIDVHCATTEGTVGQAILTYADQHSIELVAMATHGRSGLGRVVFGSVADFVLRESGLPILIIRPREITTQTPTEAQVFKRILTCLDGSKLAEQIMTYATEETLGFGGKLVLLRVVPEPVVFSPGIPGTAPTPIQTDAMFEDARRELNKARDYLEEVATPLRERGLHVETVTMLGRAGEAILSYANTNGIDLITIATHGHSGLGRAVFGSVADFVLRESALPVLVIKPRA